MALVEIVTHAIAAFGASLGTNFWNKRKNKADARKSEINNVEAAIAVWEKTSAHQQKIIENLQSQVQRMDAKISNLIKENAETKKELHEMRKENIDLKKQLNLK